MTNNEQTTTGVN